MMWAIFCLGLLEMLILHFVIVQIWPRIAIFLSMLSGLSMLWIFVVIRSFKTYPVVLAEGRLILRCGRLKSVDIAVTNIAGFRTIWPSDMLKADGVLNLSLITYPNIIIDVRQPILSYRFKRERRINSIAHRIDDLPSFIAALSRQRNVD